MKDWLSNAVSAGLALVLALIVWLVAVREENPRDLYSQPIPVSRLGLAGNLSVFGEMVNQVRIEIRAPKTRWPDLQPRDFNAYVDLNGLRAGEHDVKVNVTSPDPDVQVLGVNPPAISVRLEERRDRLVPVKVNVLDAPAFGYEALTAQISPTHVLVTGSASVADQVESAAVDMYLRGSRSTVTRSLRVSPLDDSGDAVDSVSVSPRDVEVQVPVMQLPGYREVAILVETTGRPAAGYTVNAVNADPKLVTLSGEPAAIASLSGYITVSVDINDARSDIVERVPLRLPESLSTLGTQSVSVQINIRPIQGAQTVQRHPVIQGLGPGLTYTLRLETVNVFLAGPVPRLDALREDSVPVILDLSGLGPGAHVLEPRVPAPEGISVQGVSPQSIEVVVAALPPTPTPTPAPAASTQPALPGVDRPPG